MGTAALRAAGCGGGLKEIEAMRTLLALLALLVCSPAVADSEPQKWDSAASTNSTLVRAGAAQITIMSLVNTTATIYYLKFYDKATAPTCNTDTVVFKVPIPFGASSAGGGAIVPIPDGLRFVTGIGFCLTGGLADNDNTNAAAGVSISLGIKQ